MTIIRSLICKGNNHPLRCEDDLYVYDSDNFVVSFVFDGCSSGNDSHFSSTMFKKVIASILPSIMENHSKDSTFDIATTIVTEFRVKLEAVINLLTLDTYDEMLSTLCVCVFNKTAGKCSIIICGDGVCSVDGNIHNKHDKDGNSVYYITSVGGKDERALRDNILEYLANDCFILANADVKNTVSIATDGIDSFVTPRGDSLNIEVRSLFFDDDSLMSNKSMLKRKYNRLLMREDRPMNIDDFSMVRIIID